MEHVLARWTLLVRDLLVGTHNGVANRTLCLALHCSCGISAPGGETVDQAAVLIACQRDAAQV